MYRYPTKDEILEKEVVHKKETLRWLKVWKDFWPYRNTAPAVRNLLLELADIYKKPVKVLFRQEVSCYAPREQTIKLANYSIVTALHEFAHHIYGHSEKRACRWSVWLFKQTFPEQMDKLMFKGHMLVLNPTCQQSTKPTKQSLTPSPKTLPLQQSLPITL